jgi:hypothetical protein
MTPLLAGAKSYGRPNWSDLDFKIMTYQSKTQDYMNEIFYFNDLIAILVGFMLRKILLSLEHGSSSVLWAYDISSDDRELKAKERAP